MNVEVTFSHDHAMGCQKLRNTAQLTRHNNIVRVLKSLCELAGATVQVEPKISIEDLPPSSRPEPDLRITTASISFLVDVSITHPCAQSYIKGAWKTRLYAASLREQVKHRSYDQTALVDSSTFTPFVLESFGAFGKETRAFLLWLAKFAADNAWSSSPSLFLKMSYDLIAITLQRGNGIVYMKGSEYVNRRVQAAMNTCHFDMASLSHS